MTYSIVAFSPREQVWGVAVQSCAFSVGSICSWARQGVGAVSTQSLSNPHTGPRLLERLSMGEHPRDALAALVEADEGRTARQVGVVDVQGRAAVHTGAHCVPWAGHRTGDGFSCQGNMLAGPQVVDALADTFQSEAEQPLPERLYQCLLAAEDAGGDRRGKQSAVLLVVGPKDETPPYDDRIIDLRVDDHPEPLQELGRLLHLKRELAGRPETPAQPINPSLTIVFQHALGLAGYHTDDVHGIWDEVTQETLRRYCADKGLDPGPGFPDQVASPVVVSMYHLLLGKAGD